jgi:hypothetical protein
MRGVRDVNAPTCPVQLAARLARISTDDQFQFGIRTFLAGLQAQQPERKHSA